MSGIEEESYMRTIGKIATTTLAAIAAPCLAGPGAPPTDTGLPVTAIHHQDPVTVNGAPARFSTTRTDTLVYDNSSGPFLTNTANPVLGMDSALFYPGPGAGGNFTVDAVGVAYSLINGATPVDFDMLVTFYDAWDNATTPVPSAQLPLSAPVSVRIGFTAPTQGPGIYTSNLVSLTNLPGGGILFPDNNWAFTIQFVQPNTTTPLAVGTYTIAYANSNPNTDSPVGEGPNVGSSQYFFWRDVNLNNVIDAAELRTFAVNSNTASQGNFYLKLQADRSVSTCQVDINHDGQVNVADFLAFLSAFAAGCP